MDGDVQEGRGRSARKRAAQQVEKLAQRLVDLPEKQLPDLPLPVELAKELEQVRSTRGHSSRRRAVKHLAGMLRRDEELIGRIEDHLAGVSEAHWRQQARFHRLEELRDRLCDPQTVDTVIQELSGCLPGPEIKELRRLSRVAGNGDRGAARKVFRLLRDLEGELCRD
ncbi:hypothetical protein C2E25_00605 [Geothermobacter hydrogeniphilus]|uniref:Ribosome-associated protein n=1 Tax=Geothermobacter hydrogeniphilus TaxID=1969733 RepID=A0A2K2HEN6_9BACT|nr:ribosome biogenesis factor YjgA [Geothermobacter hydrogeniphilus]PNU21762.1 hypothetical protein C2E25_00605 [Geothermobacter hydrogeniphilus]